MSTEDLRYPIGKHKKPDHISQADIKGFIRIVEQLPLKMREAVNGLHTDQLNTPYREDGWTLRQVVHHVADSHANAYIRFKLALTEENPIIKPYNENLWAELPEAKFGALEISQKLLEALHARWVIVLNSMSDAQWARTYVHPEKQITSRLDEVLALYAWHSEHHLAHITNLRKSMKW